MVAGFGGAVLGPSLLENIPAVLRSELSDGDMVREVVFVARLRSHASSNTSTEDWYAARHSPCRFTSSWALCCL